MSDNKSNNQFHNDEHIILTNFLEGGDEKRQEVLAQPEAVCNGCPNCISVCAGCAAPCTGCDGYCTASCQCDSVAASATSQSEMYNYNSIGFGQTTNGFGQVTNQAADYNENHSSSWWVFIGWE